MKTVKLLLAVTIIFLGSSCKKEGWTNNTASNYNPDAKTDNGTCVINGCTIATAVNYSNTATQDNGTCEYKAEYLLWYSKNFSDGLLSANMGDSITFKVGKDTIGTFSTTKYWDMEPDCQEEGTISGQVYLKDIKTGTVRLEFWYSGGSDSFVDIPLTANTCSVRRLGR